MVPILFYAACAVASAGLLLLLRPSTNRFRTEASVLGIAAVAGIFTLIVQGGSVATEALAPTSLMALCGFISVAAAVRVITHPRPVFSALYFVLVVISGAAIYLLLSAEFVGFSLVIVYAGAILITYLFVLMLAQQSPNDSGPAQSVDYDRIPREPAGAVFAGFVLVAVLGSSIFSPKVTGPEATAAQIASVKQAWRELEMMPAMLLTQARRIDASVTQVVDAGNGLLTVQSDLTAKVMVLHGADGKPESLTLPLSALPDNPSRVGMALVTRFPVSLELAGVILLMAMLGAVVLAKRQSEMAENERRAIAGMTPVVTDEFSGAAR